MTRIDSFDDGHEQRIEFERVPSDDPAVLSRLESVGDATEREVATTFAAMLERPETYPGGLPFIPGVEAHTNEYPASERAPRVRWSTPSRAPALFDEVVDQSIAAGWTRDDSLAAGWPGSAARKCFLRRPRHVRRVSQHDLDGMWLVELEDTPAEFANRFIDHA